MKADKPKDDETFHTEPAPLERVITPTCYASITNRYKKAQNICIVKPAGNVKGIHSCKDSFLSWKLALFVVFCNEGLSYLIGMCDGNGHKNVV